MPVCEVWIHVRELGRGFVKHCKHAFFFSYSRPGVWVLFWHTDGKGCRKLKEHWHGQCVSMFQQRETAVCFSRSRLTTKQNEVPFLLFRVSKHLEQSSSWPHGRCRVVLWRQMMGVKANLLGLANCGRSRWCLARYSTCTAGSTWYRPGLVSFSAQSGTAEAAGSRKWRSHAALDEKMGPLLVRSLMKTQSVVVHTSRAWLLHGCGGRHREVFLVSAPAA